MMSPTPSLVLADYAVMTVLLAIPMGIGVFYAWKDSNKQTKEEYLLGGKKMAMLPVALSIFVTCQSAISLMGFPSDVYTFGPMVIAFFMGIALSFVIGYFTVVPLLYPLQLTSIYQYMELRYQSRAVRMLCTVLAMLQTILVMAVVQLAPGLALEAVVGIPLGISVAIVGSVGIVYTAIGGIKSVLWTDAFQTFIVFFGSFALIIKGIMAVGGVEKVWTIAENGGRTNFNHFNPDPRLRYSWWGTIIGICISWLTNIFSQPTGQRLTAMKSMKAAKRAYLVNIPLHIFYGLVLTTTGLILYAYFYTIRCDPLQAGLISNMNQAAPFFMLHVFEDLPGMAGLYMATLFSGSLSSLSSGINALAANTLEEILAPCLRGASERRVTVMAKIVVFLHGIFIIGITYVIKSIEGPLPQLALCVTSSCGSSIVGMFIMGCTVPWANKYGAFAGGLAAHVLTMWIVLGNLFHGKKPRTLPPVPSDQCFNEFLNTSLNREPIEIGTMFPVILSQSSPSSNVTFSTTSALDNSVYEGFFLYDISYEWYTLIGVLACISTGLLISSFTRKRVENHPNSALILPFLRNCWSLNKPMSDSNKLKDHEVNLLMKNPNSTARTDILDNCSLPEACISHAFV